jgi:phosphate transport system permease protein
MPTPPVETSALFRKPRARVGERIIEGIIATVSLSSIAVIALIFLFIAREALRIFSASDTPLASSGTHQAAEVEVYGAEPTAEATAEAAPEVYNPDVSAPLPERPLSAASSEPSEHSASSPSLLQNLLGTVWQPISAQPKYGLLPLIVGTLKITLVGLLLAAPIGILAAIYAAFFAPRAVREFLKPVVEILAGFPSVVIGFFCLMVVASLVQDTLGTTYRLNTLVGGIGLAIALLPLIFTIVEDSMTALPRSFWEAGLALGARPWQVVLRIMVPAATPGIFAALLLGFGRAFGETMIVLMASGNAPLLSWSPLEPVRTMSATIGAEMGEVVWGSLHYSILFLIGLLLFAVTFMLNIVAEFWVRQRLLRRFRGISS